MINKPVAVFDIGILSILLTCMSYFFRPAKEDLTHLSCCSGKKTKVGKTVPRSMRRPAGTSIAMERNSFNSRHFCAQRWLRVVAPYMIDRADTITFMPCGGNAWRYNR